MKKDSLVALEQVYNHPSPLSHLLHTSLYPLIFSIAVGVATSVFPVNLFNNAHEDNVSITTTNVIYFIT